MPSNRENSNRYAIYFAPDESGPLWRAGSRWLGRDAITGESLAQPEIDGVAPGLLAEVTDAPRFYGFHATLKPPFHLAEGTDEARLIAAVAAFASAHDAFEAPPLKVDRMGRFLALVLDGPSPQMDRLASGCVRGFDRFRAAPSGAELERRRRQRLTARQESLLQAWGYPYVMDQFRFHLSLTGAFDDEALREDVQAELDRLFAPFATEPLAVDAVCLFRQQTRSAPFLSMGRFRLRS